MLHINQPWGERRTEPRFRVNEPALLRSQLGGLTAIRVLDISGGGLRVTATGPVPLNTAVEVELGGTKIVGLVRHCRCVRATEFQLGLSSATSLEHHPVLRRAKSA